MKTKKKEHREHRGKGTGTIYLKDGSFKLRYMVNGKLKQVALHTAKRKDAEKKAKEILEPIQISKSKEEIALHIGQARRLVTNSQILLSGAWECFINADGRPDSGESTLLRYSQYWNLFKNWITDHQQNVKHLSQISDDMVRDYFRHLSLPRKDEEGKVIGSLSGRTLNAHTQALRLVFKILLEKAGLERNPFRKEVISRREETKISRREFTENEALAILDAFNNSEIKIDILAKDEMRVLFNLGCWTGMRLGDCALLKWDSINFKNNFITVIPMKTRKKERFVQIPIHSRLRKELETAKTWKDDSEYVLPSVAKRYLYNPYGVNKDAIYVLQQCKFNTTQKIEDKGKRLHSTSVYGFHSFRHSFVSFCANAGISMAIVQSIVGHGSPAMTKHYTHIGKENLKTAIGALSFGEPKKLPAGMTDAEKIVAIMAILEGVKTTDREKQILAIISQNDKPDVSSTPALSP